MEEKQHINWKTVLVILGLIFAIYLIYNYSFNRGYLLGYQIGYDEGYSEGFETISKNTQGYYFDNCVSYFCISYKNIYNCDIDEDKKLVDNICNKLISDYWN